MQEDTEVLTENQGDKKQHKRFLFLVSLLILYLFIYGQTVKQIRIPHQYTWLGLYMKFTATLCKRCQPFWYLDIQIKNSESEKKKKKVQMQMNISQYSGFNWRLLENGQGTPASEE